MPGTTTTSSPANDERPRLALRARHLRVDEDVLHLLALPGEAVAGAPSADVQARAGRLERPPPPAHPALERHGAALQPDALVFPHRHAAVAQVETLDPFTRGEQL